MSEAQVALAPSGALCLSGVLDHQAGRDLRQAGRRLIAQGARTPLQVDCAGVEKSSSVGVALLLAYLRDAARYQRRVELLNLPADMREIARVSGVLSLLPLGE